MSQENTSFEYIKSLIAEHFDINEEIITETMTFDDLGADSLDVVEFVMELEDHYGIEFEDEKMEELNNIKDAVDYIDQLVAKQ
ncbi:acyl carrier protein [Facklamia hominis]|uniref:acyl carrier protein n=1 Tax=Facklamia hominis TaxID=178214 RepID=UPI000C7B5DAC|nr:acyl carrier protein [Facklamia hominis]PKY93682.1 acyl carrier protein [Facklamia hominis]RYC98410.1 acyl carrier protein [Facklamia hominis]